MKRAVVLLVLLIIGASSVLAIQSTKTVEIVPFYAVIGDEKTVSQSHPLSYYSVMRTSRGGVLDLNDCMYSGTIKSMGVDDRGSVTISSHTGISSASVQTGGASSNGNIGGSGNFDPHTATMSWSIYNYKGPATMGVRIEISYRDQNGYVWDGTTCSPETAKVTGIQISKETPAINEEFTVTCTADRQDLSGLTVTSSAPISVVPGEAIADTQSFTATLGAIGEQTVTCQFGSDSANGKSAQVTVEDVAPQKPQLTVQHTCENGQPTVNITWKPTVGAVEYRVERNHVAVRTQAEENYSTSEGLARQQKDVWSVFALSQSGRVSPEANDTITYTCDPAAVYDIPDRITHLYVAKKGDKHIRAWRNADAAVFIYQNLATDLSSMADPAFYDLIGGHRQVIHMPEGDTASAFWSRFTRSISLTPGGTPFGPIISAVDGESGTIRRGERATIYGVFPRQDVTITIGGQSVAPEDPTDTRYEISFIVPQGTPASTTVQVAAQGMTSNAFPIAVQ
jgi:hypothetical protein